MNQNPELKFKINKEKDVDAFFNFVDEAVFTDGEHLKWAIINNHPFFEDYLKDNTINVKKNIVEKYVLEKYKDGETEMSSVIVRTQDNWSSVSNDFFKLTESIFGNLEWPKGEYTVYPTIWGMYPRFLDNKTFQIPYKDKSDEFVNLVIAHEMLHFIFYHFISLEMSSLDTEENQMLLWHVSEIFNTVIQNSKNWVSVFKEKTPGYPVHDEIVAQLEQTYLNINSKNLNSFVSEVLEHARLLTSTS